MYAGRAKQERLIEASNWLCEYVAGKLPDGWEIVLSMNAVDATLTLIDPDGEEVECASSDQGTSQIDEMCVVAIERDLETSSK
jgi:hypothetical protein